MLLSRGLRRVRAFLDGMGDLLLWWCVLTIVQPLVPRTSFLADASLLPWIAVTLSGALLLRHRSLLPSSHLALTPRSLRWARVSLTLAVVSLPWTLLSWHVLGGSVEWPWAKPTLETSEYELPFATAAGLTLLNTTLWALGLREGATAWNPPERSGDWLLAAGLVGVCGLLAASSSGAIPPSIHPGIFTASSVLLAGLMAPPRHVRQFLAGQRHQEPAKRWRGPGLLLIPLLIGFLMPLLGMTVFHLFYLSRSGDLAFSGAMIHTLFVCLACGSLFPRPTPVAMSCVLHELEPVGGAGGTGKVHDFSEAPEGALVFNPLEVRRTRRMHPALIAVASTRLPLVDAKSPYLWPLEGLAPQSHLLGLASFESEGWVPQWRRVTLRKATKDLMTYQSETQSSLQRMLVLRPYTSSWFRRKPGVFDHEVAGWEGQVQSTGDASDRFELLDGDIILLSVGGLVRAYEFEIGAPVLESDPEAKARPPVLEDYVDLG